MTGGAITLIAPPNCALTHPYAAALLPHSGPLRLCSAATAQVTNRGCCGSQAQRHRARQEEQHAQIAGVSVARMSGSWSLAIYRVSGRGVVVAVPSRTGSGEEVAKVAGEILEKVVHRGDVGIGDRLNRGGRERSRERKRQIAGTGVRVIVGKFWSVTWRKRARGCGSVSVGLDVAKGDQVEIAVRATMATRHHHPM
jgi:hypothetical protein